MNLSFLKVGAVAVASGGCSTRSSAQRELVTSGLYTTLADSTPSTLSLLGLVRHMAEVERYWFQRCLAGADRPPIYRTDAERDRAFDGAEPPSAAEDLATWEAECASSRSVVAGIDSFDTIGARSWRDGEVSLRWILVHMIEEYSRHNGHADLLRQRIDGVTGV
ncbi:MAG: DinB family protein [Acidimicrobiales bacterium]